MKFSILLTAALLTVVLGVVEDCTFLNLKSINAVTFGQKFSATSPCIDNLWDNTQCVAVGAAAVPCTGATPVCIGGKCVAVPAIGTDNIPYKPLGTKAEAYKQVAFAAPTTGAGAVYLRWALTDEFPAKSSYTPECRIDVETTTVGNQPGATQFVVRAGIEYKDDNGNTILTFRQSPGLTSPGFAIFGTDRPTVQFALAASLTTLKATNIPSASHRCWAGVFPANYKFNAAKKRSMEAELNTEQTNINLNFKAKHNTAQCGSGLTACRGSCVNILTDLDHCGGCKATDGASCNGVCYQGTCETFGSDISNLSTGAQLTTLSDAQKVQATAFQRPYKRPFDKVNAQPIEGGIKVVVGWPVPNGVAEPNAPAVGASAAQAFTLVPISSIPKNRYLYTFVATLEIISYGAFCRDGSTANQRDRIRMFVAPAGPSTNPIVIKGALYNEFSFRNSNCLKAADEGKNITITWTQDLAGGSTPVQPYVIVSYAYGEVQTVKPFKLPAIADRSKTTYLANTVVATGGPQTNAEARLYISESIADLGSALERGPSDISINLSKIINNAS
jgi:hypothetical protein